MRQLRAPLVVAGWAIVDGVLVLGLFASGGISFEFGVFAGGVLLALVFGAALAVSTRRHPDRERAFAVPAGSGAGLLGAIGALFAGLGLIFGWWFGFLALPCVAGALAGAVGGRRRQPRR